MSQNEIPSKIEVHQISAVFGEAVALVSGDVFEVLSASQAEDLALRLIVSASSCRARSVLPQTRLLPLSEAFSLAGSDMPERNAAPGKPGGDTLREAVA